MRLFRQVLCGTGFGWQPVSINASIVNSTTLPETRLPVGFFADTTYSYACRAIATDPTISTRNQFLTGVVSIYVDLTVTLRKAEA